MSKEAMNLALEQTFEMLIDNREYIEANERSEYLAMYDKAIAGAEKALAEQPAQQEPVAWMYEGDAEFDGNEWRYPTRVTISKQVADFHGGDVHPLYTTPQAQPKREWVGLTDEEIADCMTWSIKETCRSIEAKLMEKNT